MDAKFQSKFPKDVFYFKLASRFVLTICWWMALPYVSLDVVIGFVSYHSLQGLHMLEAVPNSWNSACRT